MNSNDIIPNYAFLIPISIPKSEAKKMQIRSLYIVVLLLLIDYKNVFHRFYMHFIDDL
jgi:hypothetical protein